MRTGRCACGATLAVPEDMDRWADSVLAHVRTRRHRDWSARMEPGSDMTIIHPYPPHIYEEHLSVTLSRPAVPSRVSIASSPASTSGRPGGHSERAA